MGMMEKKVNCKINRNSFSGHRFLTGHKISFSSNPTCLQMNKQDLEDKFFRLQEDNLVLKREAHNTEYRVKFLTTKLSRLMSEKKRLLEREKTCKEIELEEKIYDLNQKISLLEKENKRLRERQVLLLTQLNTTNSDLKRKNLANYASISSRTNSGLTHLNCRSSSANAKLTLGHRSSSLVSLNRVTFSASALPFHSTKAQSQKLYSSSKSNPNPSSTNNFSNNLLKATRDEMKRLEDIILVQQQIIENYNLNKSSVLSETSLDNYQINAPKATQLIPQDDKNDHDNEYTFQSLDSDKAIQLFDPLTAEKAKPLENEKKISTQVGLFVDSLRKELVQAKIKIKQLEKQIVSENLNQTKLSEMTQKIINLTKENDILRDSFQRCVGTCLTEMNSKQVTSSSSSNGSVESRFEKLSNQLQILEKEKRDLVIDLKEEKEKYLNLTDDYNQLKINYQHLKNLSMKKVDESEKESDGKWRSRAVKIQNERQNLLNQFTNVKQIVDLVENNLVE